MKKNDVMFLFVLSIFAVCRLIAQDIADITQTDDPIKLLSILAEKQYEAIFLYNSDVDDDEAVETARKAEFELRELYLRYFKTEESLKFDRNTFYNGKLSEYINYITSDNSKISVISWCVQIDRIPDFDSIIQFRDSSGKLKTESIPQMVEKNDVFYPYFTYSTFFYKMYKLKESVYLLEGGSYGQRYSDTDFLTLELKKDTVVPYFAFKNKNKYITISMSAFGPLSIDLNYLPISLDVQIIPQPDSFSIELDMLFPKDPLNMYKYIGDHSVTEEETFKHKEKFVFNGTEFAGNYWVLYEYWNKGERPEDLSQFFPKIEFSEKANQQKSVDETDNTISGETETDIIFSNSLEETGNIKTQAHSIKNYFPLSILLLFTVILICGIYFYIKAVRKNVTIAPPAPGSRATLPRL